MSEKSFVTLEQHVCPVCGITHDTGALLLNKRLSKTFDRETVTGYGMCSEHQKLFDEGYLALVGVSNSPSARTKLKMEEANRTGRSAHIKREIANNIFNVEIPNDLSFIFVEDEVIDMLAKMQQQSADSQSSNLST